MSTLNIAKTIKKMSANDIRDLICENYYKRVESSKEDSYRSLKCSNKKDLLMFANKLIEKVPDPCNAKQHYESYLRTKNKKLVKQSETAHKLSKGEKVDSNSSLYSDTKKVKIV